MRNSRSYYQYIREYAPGFLRKYQNGSDGELGRKSFWAEMVTSTAHRSCTGEEFLGENLRPPRFLINYLHFFGWTFMLVYTYNMLIYGDIIYNVAIPTDKGLIFEGLTAQPVDYADIYHVEVPLLRNQI